MNNATAYTGFDDVTPASPFLHVHVHVLRVAKPLYCVKINIVIQPHNIMNLIIIALVCVATMSHVDSCVDSLSCEPQQVTEPNNRLKVAIR